MATSAALDAAAAVSQTSAYPATKSPTERSRCVAKLRAATWRTMGTSSGNIIATIISTHSTAQRPGDIAANPAAMLAKNPSSKVARGARHSANACSNADSQNRINHAAADGASNQRN